MFSRRLLRIKVLQILYAHFKASGKTYIQSEKDLIHSLHKSYELYHYLMLLLIEVAEYAESRIELSRTKNIPEWDDLHPNRKFVDNLFIRQVKTHQQLMNFVNKKKLQWNQHPEIIKNFYYFIIETDFYKEYMSQQDHTYNDDKKFIIKIYHDVMMNYEDLYKNLEDQNIYWIDDVDFIIKMIIKTFRKFRPEEGNSALLPMFHDEDDLNYSKELLRKTILRHKENNGLISNSAKNWELERIAFTDYLIIQMAITEAVEFKSIPIKVTMNEFIEISKVFSTRKSSQFINGILENIFSKLRQEKKIIKQGRGLIGEPENDHK